MDEESFSFYRFVPQNGTAGLALYLYIDFSEALPVVYVLCRAAFLDTL